LLILPQGRDLRIMDPSPACTSNLTFGATLLLLLQGRDLRIMDPSLSAHQV
jgi:hypothetical protein